MCWQCLMGHILDSWAWIHHLEYVRALNIPHCACSNPPVFLQHHLLSPSGQHLAFSALQFLLQKDLLHTASLSSSNSSVTQGLGSSGFMEQRWKEPLSFRWKLGGCSESSKMLVSHFVIWQLMRRRCSVLLAQPSSGRTSPQVKGWVLPFDIGVSLRERWAGATLCFRNRQKGPMESAPEDPRDYPYPNHKPVVSAFAGYPLRRRKHPSIQCIPTPRPPHGCQPAGI